MPASTYDDHGTSGAHSALGDQTPDHRRLPIQHKRHLYTAAGLGLVFIALALIGYGIAESGEREDVELAPGEAAPFAVD